MESLKEVVVKALRARPDISTVINDKVYTSEELVREVLDETEVGKKVLEMVVKGTLERYLGKRAKG